MPINSPYPPDVSLYELALSSEQPPPTLQVSPTTFKSMVVTLIDLLIAQKVPTTVWLKLPSDAAWKAEIDRYLQRTAVSNSIYILNTYQEDTIDKTEAAALADLIVTDVDFIETDVIETDVIETDVIKTDAPEMDAPELEDDDPGTGLVDDQGAVSPVNRDHSQSFSISLAAESQLKWEYFLLVLSPEFSGLMLAHHPRSVQKKASGESPMAVAKSGSRIEEELKQKHLSLLSLCSFESQTIQRVLEGIRQAIRFGQSPTRPAEEVEELLASWNSIVCRDMTGTLNSGLLGHLFMGQVQRQEEVWQSAARVSASQMENEKLLNAMRLKDEFLKNVGQELRTPLTTMKTAISLLNSSNLKSAQRQRYMEMLSHECDRQSALITSVLDLVQLENVTDQIPAQPLRLTDIVPGVVSTYQPLAQEKGIVLTYRVPEDLPAVACLNTWLRQIVINLLHNSIKFTPHGGQVWVRAKQQGDYAQLEFRDTGIGIAELEVPKIFDRFYRVRSNTAEESKGAGLGLSVVQQLLLRCGGSISVRSKLGEGSMFTILLPLYHLEVER